jgi:GST-like protein
LPGASTRTSGYGDFAQVERVLRAFLARPAVQRGLQIPAQPAG